MIKRNLEKLVQESLKSNPVVGILGPRQSGKSTLVKSLQGKRTYVNLENLQTRDFAKNDPQAFLKQFKEHGAVLDEVQRVPELFSYLQLIVDEEKKNGRFILTGSQNFLLMESITQSLAGRIALFNLLPFSMRELADTPYFHKDIESFLFQGFYPRIYDQGLNPTSWLENYFATYVERDVRSLKNVGDLSSFNKFVKLCAGRAGQLLNLSSLANDAGVSVGTVKAWISVLEASFVIFLLQPHFVNFHKRLVKSPKLYFYDVGLLSFLLGIKSKEDLVYHPNRGNIFENMVIAEFFKEKFHLKRPWDIYFWRDKPGHEIDCLIDSVGKLIPIEIKSGETIASDFFKNLLFWKKITKDEIRGKLIYGGDTSQIRGDFDVFPWSTLKNGPGDY